MFTPKYQPGETHHLKRIVDELGGHRAGEQYLVRCPAHDDRSPSLAIRVVDSKLLVHCHAGCSQASVIRALRQNGLWAPGNAAKRNITATYTYTDANGEELYQICRVEPGKNGKPKDFWQRYRDRGSGQYIWRKHPEQVLYHLGEVLRSRTVIVVEGEKDVETLRDWGFIATTWAGGADPPWLPQYTDALRGREVILIPDNDTAGRRKAAKIARALVGQVKLTVLVLEGGAKDITEWFEQGHRELELIRLIDEQEICA